MGRRRHDQNWKRLMLELEALKDAARVCLGAELAAGLAFEEKQELPTERPKVDPGSGKATTRVADRRWLIPRRDGEGKVLFGVEFQSEIKLDVVPRGVGYLIDGLMNLIDAKEVKSADDFPEMVLLVVYNGDKECPGLPACVEYSLKAPGPGTRPVFIFLIDLQRYAVREEPDPGLMHLIGRAEVLRRRKQRGYAGLFADLRGLHPGPELARLRERTATYVADAVDSMDFEGLDYHRVLEMFRNGEEVKVDATIVTFEQYMAQGEAKGLAKGRVEGRATLLHELATREFGEETADRLVEMVDPGNGMTPKVVEAIYASGTAAELLARAAKIVRR